LLLDLCVLVSPPCRVVEVELEDDMVPFGSFIQCFLGVSDYMEQRPWPTYTLWTSVGRAFVESPSLDMYTVEAVGLSGSTSRLPILVIYRLPQKPYQWLL
jgi:hypothetical protein